MSDITIPRGGTLTVEVSALDADGTVITIPDDWTTAGLVKDVNDEGEVVLDLEPIIEDGVVKVAKKTDDVPEGDYVFDIKVIDTNSDEFWTEQASLRVGNTVTPYNP